MDKRKFLEGTEQSKVDPESDSEPSDIDEEIIDIEEYEGDSQHHNY